MSFAPSRRRALPRLMISLVLVFFVESLQFAVDSMVETCTSLISRGLDPCFSKVDGVGLQFEVLGDLSCLSVRTVVLVCPDRYVAGRLAEVESVVVEIGAATVSLLGMDRFLRGSGHGRGQECAGSVGSTVVLKDLQTFDLNV